MREIKFRAWNGEYMLGPCNLWDRDDRPIDWLNDLPYPSAILMQYIGLLDKNGVEIYEGDIIAIYPCDKKHYGERAIYQVTTDETSWGYTFDWEHIAGYECSTHIMRENPINYEVIGDIYENPELLK